MPDLPDLVPVRMLNEFAYCPRLFYLEYVQGEWEESADTLEGTLRHRAVDREAGAMPSAEDAAADPDRIHARSLKLSSARLSLIARIDLVEGEGATVSPVDYKRGRAPDIPGKAWEPERVQVCAQALILRDNGYDCREGFIYFTESKERVPVRIDAELEARTLALREELGKTAGGDAPPPPLVDSPKCPRCSLVRICLPDEVNLLARDGGEARRLIPGRDDAMALYVETQGAAVGNRGETIHVAVKGQDVEKLRWLDVSQISVFGGVQVSAAAIREACGRAVPICHFSSGGWFYGITQGMPHKNVDLRIRQFERARDERARARIAGKIVEAKIRNSRTLLRRNAEDVGEGVLSKLAGMARCAARTESCESLLGVEGSAARLYFEQFGRMLKPGGGNGVGVFNFDGRNRRPPVDPVNAMLSFGYAILVKDVFVTLLAVGFDPYLGIYHVPRYGRPALALDMMEEFRPLVVDSIVLSVVNNGEVDGASFVSRGGAVALTAPGRKAFLEAYERRMDQMIAHPLFGYRVSYRRVLEIQARLLARHLQGEIPEYPPFTTR